MQQEMFHEYISQIGVLSAAGSAQLERIAKPIQLKKGEVLLDKGQVCTAYYLVASGYLCNFYFNGGKPAGTDFTFEGSFTCDLLSLKAQSPAAMQIEAGEDTLVWILDSKLLFESALLSAELMNFSRQLVSRLQLEAAEYQNLIKLNKPAERYQYIETNNPEILQRISTPQLAAHLGISRDTLGRIRKKQG
jgi:CRP-like cAMP-binding protein